MPSTRAAKRQASDEARYSDVTENMFDEGRIESQQMHEALQAQNNDDIHQRHKEFRARVRRDERELEETVGRLEGEWNKQDTQLDSAYATAVKLALSGSNTATTNQSYISVLDSSRALIADYDRLTAFHASLTGQHHTALEQALAADREKMARLIAAGRSLAEKEIAAMLGMQMTEEVVMAAVEDEDSTKAEAEKLFTGAPRDGARVRQDGGVGTVLGGLESAVRRAVRVLPRE